MRGDLHRVALDTAVYSCDPVVIYDFNVDRLSGAAPGDQYAIRRPTGASVPWYGFECGKSAFGRDHDRPSDGHSGIG